MPELFQKMYYGPNVQNLVESDNCKVMRLSDNSGEGMMTLYHVFPGVFLMYNDFHMKECVSGFQTDMDLLCIDHCREGRIEQEVGQNAFSYLEAGDLRVDRRIHHSGKVEFPLCHYHGISIGFQVETAAKEIPASMKGFSVDLYELQKKYCSDRTPYVIPGEPAIEHTIPYFLGAINEEALALENERAVLKRRLTIERRRLEENRHLMGGGFERAVKLIGEARQVGLIDSSTQVDYQNYQEVFSLLQDTLNWSPQMVSSGSGMDRLTFLQSKLQEARNEYDEIGVSLDNARKFVGEASGYSSEAQHQKVRLESIGLFEHIDFDPGKCPLCSGTLENPLPSVEMIRTSIVNLDKSIANVTREQPKLRAFISTLEQERQKKQEEIRALEAEIDGIYQQEDERARLRDINARKGKVIGRISLWVESVQNDTESEQQEQVIREIEKRVQEIDSILDTDSVDERKQSALSRIQEDMTKWAKELQLEHCDNPYRLDLNKVTVIVDKPERPVPLKQLGSGSNWVGVHLIAYFALQHYFIGAKRPVPRFMFLDQPSQVYFPSEFDEKKTDWNEVNKIYQFVIDRTTELQGQLQVIIVDHADLKKDSFREFIRENWWPDDKNLVPIDWYKSE